MPRRSSTERQGFPLLEIKTQKPIELPDGKMMHVGLLAGEPFPAQHFPAAMKMIIERHRTDIGARRLLFQNAMDLTDGDRRIGQMLEYFGHHHDIETLVAKIDGRREIHLMTGDAGF